MDRIKKFKKSLSRFLRKPNNTNNNLKVEGWYKSYQALEKYAFVDVDKQALEQQLRTSIFGQQQQLKNYTLRWSIAASLVLAASLSFWLIKQQHRTEQPATLLSSNTGTGVLKYLLLTDSTEVWLNASSVFNYPKSFGAKRREVYLPEGEAFFHVKRDTLRPFKVHVGDLEVQVLGTSFNISNYKDLWHQTIIVNTGKVKVSHHHKVLAILEKSKQITFDKENGTYEVKTANADRGMGWRSGNTVLKDASFTELAMVFKNWYGISLRSDLPEIKAFRYSLTIQRNISVAENLGMICKMQHTKYRKEGQVIELY